MFCTFLFSFWPLQLVCGFPLWHAGFLKGIPGCLTPFFMHLYNPAHRFVNDRSFAEWDVLLSVDIDLKCPHWVMNMGTWDGCLQTPVQATILRCDSTLTQACVLPISGYSVQVNRVMTYHDLDKDLMKFAAFQTLVSGCCYGVTNATSSPSVPLHPQQWYSAA